MADQRIDTGALADRGFAVARSLLNASQCRAVAALWPDKALFRSHVIMQRHGYGQGEYQYFSYPLPDIVEEVRQALYPQLFVPINLNTATREEIALIPGMTPRMIGEFLEYKPYASIDVFNREIGKYVPAAEVARLRSYVTL